jgi:hypothetical protein
MVAFALSPRRALLIGLAPLYYFIFQAVLHTEFRYTLPLHHFMFIFAAIGWVVSGYLMWRGAVAIGRRLGIYPRAS